MTDLAGIQDHVLRTEVDFDHFAVLFPADDQAAVDDQEAFLDLMAVAGGVFARFLVDQGEGEMIRLQRRGVADLRRTAGADVTHLGAGELRKADVRREGFPVEALVDKAAGIGLQSLLKRFEFLVLNVHDSVSVLIRG